MFGYPQQPLYIVQQPTPTPSAPVDMVASIKGQVEGLLALQTFFEEQAKKGKKEPDKKPSGGSNFDWKAFSHLLFWTSPITGFMMLQVYAALLHSFTTTVSTMVK